MFIQNDQNLETTHFKNLLSVFNLFQHKIWKTFENDAIFAHQPLKPTLEQARKRTMKQVLRVVEYNFLNEDDLFDEPLLVTNS